MKPACALASSAAFAVVYASGPSQYQTICATGRYAKVNHRIAKRIIAENLKRSAKPPVISATVIAAKVSWNMQYTKSGRYCPLLKVAATAVAGSSPSINTLSHEPQNGLPAVNATL